MQRIDSTSYRLAAQANVTSAKSLALEQAPYYSELNSASVEISVVLIVINKRSERTTNVRRPDAH